MVVFKEGDVVCLKSGGPEMTIEKYPLDIIEVEHDKRALCTWIKDGKPYHDKFYLSALELAKEPED